MSVINCGITPHLEDVMPLITVPFSPGVCCIIILKVNRYLIVGYDRQQLFGIFWWHSEVIFDVKF